MNSILNSDIFKKDKYLFSLVSHNLEYNNYQIISDNKNYIIIIGKPNKEIWIWSNNLDESVINEIVNRINTITNEYDCSFVCKQELFNKLKDKIDYINDPPFIYNNYICENIIKPKKVDGFLSKLTIDDKETIANYWEKNCKQFNYNISYELCLKFAESWIKTNNYYAWKNNNKIVSFIGYDIIDKRAEISHAYTVPSERGKGYMPYLIYEVTKIIMENGLIPVLNTDFSYESSNNAYKKIGYKETELMYSFSTTKHKKKSIKK